MSLLGFKQNEKSSIKETFPTREGFMEAALQTRK
jgi:hypothetical protein